MLVSASKLRSRAVKAYERREPSELSLVSKYAVNSPLAAQPTFLKTSLDAYIQYLAAERRGKSPDVFIVRGLYERSIAEAEKHRFAGERNAGLMLRSLWLGYIDFLVCERKTSFIFFV